MGWKYLGFCKWVEPREKKFRKDFRKRETVTIINPVGGFSRPSVNCPVGPPQTGLARGERSQKWKGGGGGDSVGGGGGGG